MIKIKDLLFDANGDLNGNVALISIILIELLGGMVETF